jgi:hypothetical protein
MIGAPELFRSWNELGANGLTDVQRYVRAEFRDGNWTTVLRPAARTVADEPTLLRRLASALHLIPARTNVPAAHRVAGLHAGIAAVHFADEPTYASHRPHAATSAVLMVTCEGECEGHDIDCNQP